LSSITRLTVEPGTTWKVGADGIFYSPIYARLFLPPIVSINSLTRADGGGS
jgi:hypothetical protein